jgi:hypothetical protein
VEDEGEVADLRGSLELHLKGLNVEGGLAGLVEDDPAKAAAVEEEDDISEPDEGRSISANTH